MLSWYRKYAIEIHCFVIFYISDWREGRFNVSPCCLIVLLALGTTIWMTNMLTRSSKPCDPIAQMCKSYQFVDKASCRLWVYGESWTQRNWQTAESCKVSTCFVIVTCCVLPTAHCPWYNFCKKKAVNDRTWSPDSKVSRWLRLRKRLSRKLEVMPYQQELPQCIAYRESPFVGGRKNITKVRASN